MFSLILFVFSHMLCMFSLILLYSVSSYLYSVILFAFCHLIYIQSSYIFSDTLFMFSLILFVFSHMLWIFSLILFVFSQIIYVFSLILYIFSQLFSEAATRERDSNTGVFLWILRNFSNIYSEEHGWVAASVFCILLSLAYRARVHRFEETLPCQLLCEGNDNNKSPLSNIMATCYI